MRAAFLVAAVMILTASVAAAEDLPWHRVHGEIAASYWVGGDSRSLYGVGKSPGFRATVGIAITRHIEVNCAFRFVSIDAGLGKAVDELGLGARYLIPRGSLVYFGDLQLAFPSMRSNDVLFEGDGRNFVPSPELSLGLAYELNPDASIAGMLGGGLELIKTEDGSEAEPYAVVQLVLIAYFGNED